MEFENEVWKDIERYNGRYQISNYGRIWNTITQKYMKPQMKKSGYYSINLMKPNKKVVTERVHRLVALYFCVKPNGCNIVNHLDSNKTNNFAENLEWTTVSGNTKHCYDNNSEFRKQVAQNSKKGIEKTIFTIEVLNKDKSLIGVFKGYKTAAKALGIYEKTIRNYVHNKVQANRKGYEINIISKGGGACEHFSTI